MSDISNWFQDNWFELGSLIAQFAIVFLLARYGRIALRLRPASQEHVEATLSASESAAAFVPAEPSPAGHAGVGRMLSPMPDVPALQSEPVVARRERTARWRAIISWLQSPMGAPSRRLSRPAC